MNTPHMNPRIEVIAKAQYEVWHANLFGAPTWENASHMVRVKFFRMVEAGLAAALNEKRVA